MRACTDKPDTGGVNAPASVSVVFAQLGVIASLQKVSLTPSTFTSVGSKICSDTCAKLLSPVIEPTAIASVLSRTGCSVGSRYVEELKISPLTVKNHVRKILRKLNVHNRAAAVSRAIGERLITP